MSLLSGKRSDALRGFLFRGPFGKMFGEGEEGPKHGTELHAKGDGYPFNIRSKIPEQFKVASWNCAGNPIEVPITGLIDAGIFEKLTQQEPWNIKCIGMNTLREYGSYAGDSLIKAMADAGRVVAVARFSSYELDDFSAAIANIMAMSKGLRPIANTSELTNYEMMFYPSFGGAFEKDNFKYVVWRPTISLTHALGTPDELRKFIIRPGKFVKELVDDTTYSGLHIVMTTADWLRDTIDRNGVRWYNIVPVDINVATATMSNFWLANQDQRYKLNSFLGRTKVCEWYMEKIDSSITVDGYLTEPVKI